MITITQTGNRISVSAPYHPEFPTRARNLGGKWNPTDKTWVFDSRDASRVQDLCDEIYAYRETDLVTVMVEMDQVRDQISGGELWLFGRQIARRGGRDWQVRLGDGVVVVAGGFPSSGGSVKHPTLAPRAGTILEVRDVPRSLVTAQAGISILGQEVR